MARIETYRLRHLACENKLGPRQFDPWLGSGRSGWVNAYGLYVKTSKLVVVVGTYKSLRLGGGCSVVIVYV